MPPTEQQDAAYASHEAWLSEVKAAYARMQEREQQPVASGSAPPKSPFSSCSSASQAGRWTEDGEDQMDDHLGAAFAPTLEFQDFDEGPVYRSAFGSYEGPDDDAPVYRSLSMPPAAQEGRGEASSNEEEWLRTMPPMLRRQNATIGRTLVPA